MRCIATGKVRHANQAAAVYAMKCLNNRGLNSYRCDACRGWHLGNDRKNQNKVQARIDQLLGERAQVTVAARPDIRDRRV